MIKGKEYKQELFYEVFDCFTENTETISVFNERDYAENILIEVYFPKERPVKSAKSYFYYGERKELFDQPVILNNNLFLALNIVKPHQGYNYIIEWSW